MPDTPSRNLRTVYLCHKYSDDTINNAEASCLLWDDLQDIVDGYGYDILVFNPLWSHYQANIVLKEDEYDFWISWDLDFIEAHADALVYLGSHVEISKGVQAELEHAAKLNIPAFDLETPQGKDKFLAWCNYDS